MTCIRSVRPAQPLHLKGLRFDRASHPSQGLCCPSSLHSYTPRTRIPGLCSLVSRIDFDVSHSIHLQVIYIEASSEGNPDDMARKPYIAEIPLSAPEA